MSVIRLWKMLSPAGLILAGFLFSGCESHVAPRQAGPAEVAFVTVQSEKVVLTTELPGRTTAYLVAEIRPQVSGLAAEAPVSRKAPTSGKATSCIRSIPTPYQAAYDQAKAALATAEANVGHGRSERRHGGGEPAGGPVARRAPQGLVAIHVPSASRTMTTPAPPCGRPRPTWRYERRP